MKVKHFFFLFCGYFSTFDRGNTNKQKSRSLLTTRFVCLNEQDFVFFFFLYPFSIRVSSVERGIRNTDLDDFFFFLDSCEKEHAHMFTEIETRKETETTIMSAIKKRNRSKKKKKSKVTKLTFVGGRGKKKFHYLTTPC